MTEKIKQGFESLTLSMRFVLPIMLTVAWTFYQNDMRSLKESLMDIKTSQAVAVTDLKTSNGLIWSTLNQFKDDTNNKFIAIYQRLGQPTDGLFERTT
jgi:hypothetical protein